MKVKVTVEVKTNPDYGSTLDLVIGPNDTVAQLKARVTSLQLLPYPDQEVKLGSQTLQDGQKLSSCGVKDGSSLVLNVTASESGLEKQLTELLQARDLSCDELGLLYCYKFGVSVSQVMKALGQEGKLQDFLKTHKGFMLESNRVSLVREDTSLRPFSVKNELVKILQTSSAGKMEIKELTNKFAEKFNMSIASITGVKPAAYFAREPDTFTLVGRSLVSLTSSLPKAKAPPQSTNSRSSRTRAQAIEEECEPPPGLPRAAKAPDAEEALSTAENQQYIDLHNTVCSRAFNSKAAKALVDVVEAIQESTFLNVSHVVKGGSMGKGTAITVNAPDAEVVFFLHGLPCVNHNKWLSPMLRAVAAALNSKLIGKNAIEDVHPTEDSVRLTVRGVLNVDVRFSPVFDSFVHVLKVMAKQEPELRRYYSAALVEQRVNFVSRQPGSVKLTIRLLKWWRGQQEWSSKLFRPSDDILELIAIYSSVQTKPADQQKSIANVMSLLSRFDELRIVWSNFYNKEDVWEPLLQQRPLLMDPANPYVNIADPQAFNPRELMAYARSTHFFW